MSVELLNIEVAYARSDKQVIVALQVDESCTVEQAIELADIIRQFPEIDLAKNKVGIFSRVCFLSTRLQENDRVEIYRSLAIDPMEARRQRAVKQGR
ncbi:MAG: RnfH family protein [Gammaproteobacteria bacterium]|nr:RnfH family protein [Gammaproteobacteria bacterium]MBT5221994.1 RnfH family protein [Gammaproteobacteria bacterium]MBT5826188.1 RnfH family protein [Gammaproteobacteria bacterium]MBT7435421.1 RnfH family protein [Gammaproteobacteria bacterium]